MIIPPAKDRLDFYCDVIKRCETSLADRQAAYANYRQYFLFGGLGTQRQVKQNRLRDKLNLLSSLLYGQEATKFSLKFAPFVPDDQKIYSDTLHEVALDLWHGTDADRCFGDVVTWAGVYGSMMQKICMTPFGIQTYPLSPGCFAVMREDTDRIAHQEALVHTYWVSKSQLWRELAKHPSRDEIFKRLTATKKEEDPQTIPSTVQRMIITQVQPSMVGAANVDGQGLRVMYSPQVEDEVVELKETWIWDDSLQNGDGDYRIWTAAIPDITIYDRPNFFIPQENPFIKVSPIPIYDYFWGYSLCGALLGLQDWRDKRLGQIDLTLERQLRPSRIGIGGTNLSGEKIRALDAPGGFHNVNQPNAKIDTYKPEMPEDAWRLIDNIDEQMNEIMGLQKTIQGRGEEGVRSEGHAVFLGRMASAPIKKLALLTEDSLEDVITLMLKLRCREDKRPYLADKDSDGKKKRFLLSQVSPEYRVKVSAHSSSPVFAEENRQMAEGMFKNGVIGKQTYAEMLDPPMLETVLARLPELEKAQAKVAELQAQQEASKAEKNLAQAAAARAKAPLSAVK